MSGNPQSGGVQHKVAILSDPGNGRIIRTDITPIIHEFHIYESIFKPTMTAVVSVYDANGSILNDLPFSGQEWIVIGIGEATYSFRAYKIENVTPAAERAFSYNIHCIQPEFEISLNKAIFNHFAGELGSDIVSAIHSEHLTVSGQSKSLEVETTDRPLTYTAAGHNPIEFIQMVAADSQSAEYPDSSLMMFYQDREGFKFKSVNKMLETRPVAEFYYADPGTERGPRSRNYILGITWHDAIDAINGLRNGLYDNTVMAIDINTKTFKETVFNYAKQFGELTHIRNGGKPVARAKSWGGTVLGDQLEGSSHVRFIPTDFNTDIENQTIDNRISETNDPHIFFSKNKHNFLGHSTSLMAVLRQYKIDITSNYVDGVKAGDTVNIHIPSNAGNQSVIDRYISIFGQRNPTFLVTGSTITYDGVDGGVFLTLQCAKESLSESLGGLAADPVEEPTPPTPQQREGLPSTSGEARGENQEQTPEEAAAAVEALKQFNEELGGGVAYAKLTPQEKQYAIEQGYLDADTYPDETFA
jgi:hypothetical protein